MDIEMIHKLKKNLCKQLEGYSEIQNLGGKALEDVAYLVKTIKNLDLIAEQEMGGQSMRGSSYGSSYGSYEGGGSSQRRGRDSMGRYTSREDGSSMRGSSYHEGGQEMQQAIEEIKRKLDQIM